MKVINQSFKILSPSTPERALETLRLIEYAPVIAIARMIKSRPIAGASFLAGL